MSNNEIRKAMLEKRKALTPEFIAQKSQELADDITSDPRYKECKVLYLYFPIQNEIDTNMLLVKALRDGKTVAAPIILTSGDMVFGKINPEHQDFRKGRYDILEPVFDPKDVIDQPGLMIVPLVAFHKNRRIGHGKQYYNDYLAPRVSSIYTIGVGFKFQEVMEEVEEDPRDILLNEIRAY